jgi:hypothetical protein
MLHVKRALLSLFSAILASILVVGIAFAGGSAGGGADNGLKWGNELMPYTYACKNGYELVWISNDYDLNGDGAVCWKEVDHDDFYVDDTSFNFD